MSAIPSLGNFARQPWQPGCLYVNPNPLFQEAEQSVKLMIDSVAAAELDTVRKRHKEVLQVIIADLPILYLILNSLYFAGKQ